MKNLNIEFEKGKETYVGNSYINLLKGIILTKTYNIELLQFLVKQSLLNSHKSRLNPKSMLCDSYHLDKTAEGMQLNINSIAGANEESPRGIIRKIGIADFNLKLVDIISPDYTPINTDLYKIISSETAKVSKNYKVIPYTTPGYSDNRFMRNMDKVVYGFFPLSLDDNLSGIHGYNENISIQGLLNSNHLMHNIISRFTNYI